MLYTYSGARRARAQGIAAVIVGIILLVIGFILIGLYARYLNPQGSIPFALFLAITPVAFLVFGAWGVIVGANQYARARRYIRRAPRYL